MTVGSDEWMLDQCTRISEQASAELAAIATHAVQRHGAEAIPLNQTDATKIAVVLCETQNQSFTLGVKMGIEACVSLIQKL